MDSQGMENDEGFHQDGTKEVHALYSKKLSKIVAL